MRPWQHARKCMRPRPTDHVNLLCRARMTSVIKVSEEQMRLREKANNRFVQGVSVSPIKSRRGHSKFRKSASAPSNF